MDYLQLLRQSLDRFLERLAVEDESAGRSRLQWSRNGYGPASRGATTGRYVVLRSDMGHGNERLLDALTEAALYQLIPWNTEKQKAQVYLDQRYIAIEAPLPMDAQQNDIELKTLTNSQHGGNVWILGPNERGVTVSLALRNIIHVLIGGETGSGKTYALRSLVYQMANGKNQIVLLDGKGGEGLAILNGVPGQVGPLATTAGCVTNALGWVHAQMAQRYEAVLQRGGRAFAENDPDAPPHIWVFFDDFQTFKNDATVMALLFALASRGRAARIHLVAATQKPTVSMFGNGDGGATRDQFTTRLALAVQSFQASDAIIGGSTPRADFLLGRGDAYIVSANGFSSGERVQIAYVNEDDLYRLSNGGQPTLDQWSAFDASVLGSGNGVGRPKSAFTDIQIAAAIYAAQQSPQWGQGKLQGLLKEIGEPVPGSVPASRLLKRGQKIAGIADSFEGGEE